MTWSMPRPALQLVAALLALIAIGAFVSGILTAAPRARLPGEGDGRGTLTAPVANVVDATPLTEDRIEGVPPPPELTPEQQAALDAEKKAKEEEAMRQAAAAPLPVAPIPMAPTPGPAPADKVGDLLNNVAPPQEEPPH